MRVRCRYPRRVLLKIEKAMIAENWKEAKQQSRILLSHLVDGGELPRMDQRQKTYILKGYLRYIANMPEG